MEVLGQQLSDLKTHNILDKNTNRREITGMYLIDEEGKFRHEMLMLVC